MVVHQFSFKIRMAAGLTGLTGLTAQELVVLMEFKPEAGAAMVSTAQAQTVSPKSAFPQKNALVFCIFNNTKF